MLETPSRTSRRTSRRGKTQPIPNELKRYVREFVGQQEEVKNWETSTLNVPLPIVVAASAPNNLYLLPLILQGNTLGTRVGGKIRIKEAWIDICYNLTQYNSVTNPQAGILVRVMVLKCLTVNSGVFANSNYLTIWQLNNTDANLQGNIADVLLSPNAEEYTCYYDATIQLNYSSAVAGSSNGGQGLQTFDSQGCFTKKLRIDYAKFIKRELVFDGTSNVASNDNLFLVHQPVYNDGTQGSPTIIPVECHFVTHVRYTDA